MPGILDRRMKEKERTTSAMAKPIREEPEDLNAPKKATGFRDKEGIGSTIRDDEKKPKVGISEAKLAGGYIANPLKMAKNFDEDVARSYENVVALSDPEVHAIMAEGAKELKDLPGRIVFNKWGVPIDIKRDTSSPILKAVFSEILETTPFGSKGWKGYIEYVENEPVQSMADLAATAALATGVLTPAAIKLKFGITTVRMTRLTKAASKLKRLPKVQAAITRAKEAAKYAKNVVGKVGGHELISGVSVKDAAVFGGRVASADIIGTGSLIVRKTPAIWKALPMGRVYERDIQKRLNELTDALSEPLSTEQTSNLITQNYKAIMEAKDQIQVELDDLLRLKRKGGVLESDSMLMNMQSHIDDIDVKINSLDITDSTASRGKFGSGPEENFPDSPLEDPFAPPEIAKKASKTYFGIDMGPAFKNIDYSRPQTSADFGAAFKFNQVRVWEGVIEQGRFIEGLRQLKSKPKSMPEFSFGEFEVGMSPITITNTGEAYGFQGKSIGYVRNKLKELSSEDLARMAKENEIASGMITRSKLHGLYQVHKDDPQGLLAAVINSPEIEPDMLKAIMNGTGKYIELGDNPVEYLESAVMSGNIPKTMQMAYLVEMTKQMGLRSDGGPFGTKASSGNVDYGQIKKIMDNLPENARTNMFDAEFNEIFDSLNLVQDPLRKIKTEDLTNGIKEIKDFEDNVKRSLVGSIVQKHSTSTSGDLIAELVGNDFLGTNAKVGGRILEDDILFAIMSGDVSKVGATLPPTKQIKTMLADGKISPLPPKARAAFMIDIMRQAGLHMDSDLDKFDIKELKSIVNKMTDQRKLLFFGNEVAEFDKFFDNLSLLSGTDVTRRKRKTLALGSNVSRMQGNVASLGVGAGFGVASQTPGAILTAGLVAAGGLSINFWLHNDPIGKRWFAKKWSGELSEAAKWVVDKEKNLAAKNPFGSASAAVRQAPRMAGNVFGDAQNSLEEQGHAFPPLN